MLILFLSNYTWAGIYIKTVTKPYIGVKKISSRVPPAAGRQQELSTGQTHIQPHAPLVGRVARGTPMGGSLPIGGGVVIYPQREQYLSSRGSVCAGDVLYMTIPQSMQCIVYIFVYL